MNRYFLGWDVPFITRAVDWLWARKDEMAETLIVVPTAEGGRKVRQALAERGACFAPTVYTAGRFGALGYQGEENLLLEQLLWERTLENYDWGQCAEIFPQPKAEGWAANLAEELRRLRVQTGEYGMTFHTVAQRLKDGHIDSARWQLLANWEAAYYGSIKQLGAMDSHEVRNADYTQSRLPAKIKQVIFLGVTDPTEQAVRMGHACHENNYGVHVLISAPEEHADGFDEVGRPVSEYWAAQKIKWKGGNERIKAVADIRSLTPSLLDTMAETIGSDNGHLSLGVGDKEVAPFLKSAFKEKGLRVYDPAGTALSEWSFVEWYRVWVRFAKQERIEDLRVIIRSPWMGRLVEGFRKDLYWLSKALEEVAESAKPMTISDLWHVKSSEWPFDDRNVKRRREYLDDVLDVVQATKDWRGIFKKKVSAAALRAFLEAVLGGEESEEALIAEGVFTSLEKEAGLLPEDYKNKVDFSHEFLKRLEVERVGDARDQIHVEALGWLELAFEPAPHLFITGLNEGVLPNTEIGDTWLPESLRKSLGMRTNQERYAHDVYYLMSLLSAREAEGSVHGFFLKTGRKGDPLKPSRLLLQVPAEELAERVKHCFSGAFYSIQGLPWERDWKLAAPRPNPVLRLSPSSIKDYLQCPFRFYLKHVLGMNKPSETLQEWNHMEYGTIIHEVLERMEGNEQILAETSKVALEKWFYAELDFIIEKQFSTQPALAFQIQRESMRQRLSFFAAVETEDRVENPGWRTIAFEKRFEFFVDGIKIRGIIDRIDEHEDGRLRVVDYKTGKEKSAIYSHLHKLTPSFNIPHHLDGTDVLITHDGKPHIWKNLQLPIYALWCEETYKKCPQLRYGLIGQTVAETSFADWDFTEDDLENARRALQAVVDKVKEGIFFPPVERPSSGFDDYSDLAYGFPLDEGVEEGDYLLDQPKEEQVQELAPTPLAQANFDF